MLQIKDVCISGENRSQIVNTKINNKKVQINIFCLLSKKIEKLNLFFIIIYKLNNIKAKDIKNIFGNENKLYSHEKWIRGKNNSIIFIQFKIIFFLFKVNILFISFNSIRIFID